MARVNIPQNVRDEANYDILSVSAYSVSSASTTVSNVKTVLFNDVITKEGSYGALMLYGNRHIEFEVYHDFSLWVTGTVYTDNGGTTPKPVQIYNILADGSRVLLETPSTYDNGNWYKLFSAKRGRYMIVAPTNYVSFNEFYFEKDFLNKIGLKTREGKHYGIQVLQKSDGSNLALTNNIANITASKGTATNIINNTSLGVSSGWYSSASTSGWVKFELYKPLSIDKIGIVSYYGSGYEPIDSFTFEASTTGAFNGEQVVLFEGNHPYLTTTDYKLYSFRNSMMFKYYRIRINSIHYGNGANDLAIAKITFYKETDLIIPVEIPLLNQENMSKYFNDYEILTDGLNYGKSYVLQDTISENADGLWVQELDRKPLSIKFE